MTQSAQRSLKPVTDSASSQESFIKPTVQQMKEKNNSASGEKEDNLIQPKADAFGRAPLIQQSSIIQARLQVGASNDPYEKEADQIADQVTQGPNNSGKKPAIQKEVPGASKGATESTIQRSENEDEFAVYHAHRLKMFDDQIAAIPEGPEREGAVKKLTKERKKFDAKATKFSAKMTKKGGWDNDNYKEKRDKKFGSDYGETIEDKKKEVKEGIASTVNSITSTITASTTLISNAISASESDKGKAEKLLTAAEDALKEAKAISTSTAAANDAGDAKMLSELAEIIKKMEILVTTIRTNRDGLMADKAMFVEVRSKLQAQQAKLDELLERTNKEDDVLNLIDIQNNELPKLKASIDASVTAANETKPATTLIDEASTTTNIDALRVNLVQRLVWLDTKAKDTGKKVKYEDVKPLITDANVSKSDRDAVKAHPVVGKSFFMKLMTRSNAVEVMTDLKLDLKTQIEWVRAKAGLKEVKQVIENASTADRDVVWKDATYLSTLRTAVGDNYYLWVISALRMNHSGTTAHTSASDADTAIQTHLSAYVTDAVADGRKIEGMVAVVDDVNWKIAGEFRYGATVWATKKLSGFKDKQGRVWIHKDKGNVGTMVHEAVHKYSDNVLLYKSQPLNEGVTEYFTRKVANAAGLNITTRNNYAGNYATTVKLVALVGEAAVAKAYFDGDMAGLKKAFVAKKSASDWKKFLAKTKSKSWSDADTFL